MHDAHYAQAVQYAQANGKVSKAMLANHLQIGYHHACRLVETMLASGVLHERGGLTGVEYHLTTANLPK